MRRVIAIAVAGLSLAGCSSFSLDSFKSAPPPIQVQLDSAPQGADAVTSLGPGCKTPCSVSIPTPETNFSVSFNLPRYQPTTVPVRVTSPTSPDPVNNLADCASRVAACGELVVVEVLCGIPAEELEIKMNEAANARILIRIIAPINEFGHTNT